MTLPWLDPDLPPEFPPTAHALKDPSGLLAFGGKLNAHWLQVAYRSGIFPWFNPDEPILWWSPDPRMVVKPEAVKVHRSLKKTLRKQHFSFTVDQAFEQVMHQCAGARNYTHLTWITDDIKAAYIELHQKGYAHSIETWCDGKLVGGLYGVSVGKIFCGESMFSHVSDASKAAFVYLATHLKRWDYQLIDCQVYTDHLASLGAAEIGRTEFMDYLKLYGAAVLPLDAWQGELCATSEAVLERLDSHQ
ncbi:leucyl/phenylalanyl-tRNA--protein transferase [Oceanospirillum multiglobuliferum]|uniref:Leucyl/phenylalanyl-tRNA--protein transferase n=1 Tax=Oceanospirillum multiglobuliferum TaxID=64969 RepID=A0A1V4T968_9GAMM|nr:leucyl/phenylalanyl-tRNA--protein transferase [Oceanospirillum multiglobuliferum]